jgi:hypothetical protein
MTEKELYWLKILRWSSLYVFVTGLLPVLAVFEATQEPWRLFYDVLTWPLDGQPSGLSSSERQLSAIIGGVLCGWAWLLYCLSKPEIFNQQLRRLMLNSIWIWFVLDSAGSAISGLPLNVVSNLVFFLILVIPLYKLKSGQS